MAGIKAGDNGTVLEFPIKDNGVVVPLNNATVKVVFKIGERRFEKEAVITNAANGVCQVALTSEDIATPGVYVLQGILKQSNGNEFASDTVTMPVGGRI